MNDMNTNDLSTLLRERAGTVPTTDSDLRIGQLRGRVRAVRRRRTAGAVAAVVAALAGVAGLQTLQHDRQVTPAGAPRELVGRDVPRTIDRLGATYTYVKGYEADDGDLTVTVPASADPMVMRVATQSDNGRVRVERVGADSSADDLVLPAGDFGYQFDSIGVRAEYKVASSQPVALALYRLSKPPVGVQSGGITFPRTSAGELQGARVGAAGQDTVTFTVAGAVTRLRLSEVCAGSVPRGAGVSVDLGRGPMILSNGCDEHLGTVFNANNGGTFDVPAAAGKRTVRVTLVDARQHPIPVPDGTRIGAAIYGLPPMADGLEQVIEFDGHRWVLNDTVARGGPRGVATTVDASRGPVLVLGQTTAADVAGQRGVMRLRVGNEEQAVSSVGGSSWFRLAAGRRVPVALTTSPDAGALSSLLAVYSLYD